MSDPIRTRVWALVKALRDAGVHNRRNIVKSVIYGLFEDTGGVMQWSDELIEIICFDKAIDKNVLVKFGVLPPTAHQCDMWQLLSDHQVENRELYTQRRLEGRPYKIRLVSVDTLKQLMFRIKGQNLGPLINFITSYLKYPI